MLIAFCVNTGTEHSVNTSIYATLKMKLYDLLEAKKLKKIVCVFGGRFQPFHKGHYQAYKWLCKKFGKDNVWIATSNKTNYDSSEKSISPFTFKDKKEIIVGLHDISSTRIVNCKNPAFSPKEIFKQYHGYEIIYIAAVGDKDEARYAKSDFFTPLPEDYKESKLKTLSDGVGYYVLVPGSNISGTKAREALANDPDSKEIFKKYFGKYDELADALITARLKEIK